MGDVKVVVNEDGQEVQYINYGGEDQMELYGYKRSKVKSVFIILAYILSLGLLRLFFHWYPRYRLIQTHTPCSLDVAEKVLVVDNYKGKYKTFYVEEIFTLTTSSIQPESDGVEGGSLTFYCNDSKMREVNTLKTFTCKRLKYVWDGRRHGFVKLCGLENGIAQSEFHTCRGFTEKEQRQRRVVYGTNDIDIPLESIPRLFLLEALTPFYIFQVFSIIVWMCENYYYYAVAIIVMSVFGIGSSVIQTRKNQSNLRGTINLTDNVLAKRAENTYESIPTTALVPGDIIVIPSHGCMMHCDSVLLNGMCIVNESMLTGESVPVTKTAIPNADKPFDIKEDSNHILYCGTKIIQTRFYGDEQVLAVVIRTGFLTSKGQLVRSIIYPPPADFKFDQDSYKFMLILAAISAAGVLYTIVSKSTRNISFNDIIIKALDTITIVIPPALPAAMTVGKLYALGRLKMKNIFCINSRVINVAGSIDCICFDKTGTLTEDGLDMWGIVPMEEDTLHIAHKSASALPNSSKFLQGMASCHSLTLIDDKLEGDPLDVKMFESTKWVLEEPNMPDTEKYDLLVPRIVKPKFSDETDIEIGIIHQHQFSSNLQRMSVITKRLGSQTFELFCKGSPETIVTLSNPRTIPDNIAPVLRGYTEKGYRVIAIGYRELESTNLVRIQKQSREDVECDLEFLGLIVLENKLKPQTAPIIKTLKDARFKMAMITGDNKLTALSVARDCGLIDNGAIVVDVEVKPPTKTEDAKQIFNIIQPNPTVMFKPRSITNIEKGTPEPFSFVMTGQTWASLREYFPSEIPKFVARGTVFARMTSNQKQELIEEFKALGYYVAMCGDGSNDCGALKAAHVGISLSEAESSVAAPFTSVVTNISCVPEIIKQGRAALVTSFGIFKFMVTYSLTEFTSVIILYGIDCNLGNIQYLYIDLCMIMVMAGLFGRTDAYEKKLFKKAPVTSLLSFVPLTSILLHMISVIVFQILSYHIIQTYSWFKPFEHIPDENIFIAYENYAVFGISVFQYISTAIVFSKGPPYRKKIYTNRFFTGFLVLAIAVNMYIILNPAQWIIDVLELLVPPKYDGKILVLILAFANFLLTYILEEFVCDIILYRIVKPKFHNVETSRKKFLKVEQELSLDSKWKFSEKKTRFEVMTKPNVFHNTGFVGDHNGRLSHTRLSF